MANSPMSPNLVCADFNSHTGEQYIMVYDESLDLETYALINTKMKLFPKIIKK